MSKGLSSLRECVAALDNQLATIDWRLALQDQRSALQDQRSVKMEEGIEAIRAMMMSKGADNWAGSWGEAAKTGS